MAVSKSTVHLIDLGLAKMFLNKNTHEHVRARKIRKTLTGTARLSSPDLQLRKLPNEKKTLWV